MKKVAIMQPTYLPWMGYFDLMDQCDLFVFLDSVQFDRRSWQQRNRIKSSQGALWLTVPVLSKGRRDQKISEVEIDSSQNFQGKHLGAIRNSYAKAKYLNDYFDSFAEILEKPRRFLSDLNIELIEWFKIKLGIKTPFLRSSSLKTKGKKVDLLISICQLVGASDYISPVGAQDYIEQNNSFVDHGIRLHYHQYQHPLYHQCHNDFISHLSVADLIFNMGDESASTIRSGRKDMQQVFSDGAQPNR